MARPRPTPGNDHHPIADARPSPPGRSPPEDLGPGDAAVLAALRDEGAVALALAAVYRRHAPAVRAHLRRVGVDPDLADDAVQEAVIHLWRQRAALPDGLALRAWLAVVAGRRAVDALRRGWHRRPRPGLGSRASIPGGDDPAEIALRNERRLQVRRLLAALDPDERALVYLTYWRGWSQARLAAALGVSPAALNSWAHRVRRHLAGAWRALEAGRQPSPRRRLARRDAGR